MYTGDRGLNQPIPKNKGGRVDSLPKDCRLSTSQSSQLQLQLSWAVAAEQVTPHWVDQSNEFVQGGVHRVRHRDQPLAMGLHQTSTSFINQVVCWQLRNVREDQVGQPNNLRCQDGVEFPLRQSHGRYIWCLYGNGLSRWSVRGAVGCTLLLMETTEVLATDGVRWCLGGRDDVLDGTDDWASSSVSTADASGVSPHRDVQEADGMLSFQVVSVCGCEKTARSVSNALGEKGAGLPSPVTFYICFLLYFLSPGNRTAEILSARERHHLYLHSHCQNDKSTQFPVILITYTVHPSTIHPPQAG